MTHSTTTASACLPACSALGLPHLRLPRPLLYGRKGGHGHGGKGRSAMGDHDDDDSMLEDETQALLTSRPQSSSSSSSQQQPWTSEAADRRAGQGAAAAAHTAVRFAAL